MVLVPDSQISFRTVDSDLVGNSTKGGAAPHSVAIGIVADRERGKVGVARVTLRSNQEMEAILQWTNALLSVVRQQQPNERNKRAAVSSDEKQLATGNKRRRVAKAAVKPEEEFGVKKGEESEDDLHQLDRYDPEDGRRRPIAAKKEKEDEVDHELEDSIQPPAAAKEEENDETEVKEHGETDFQRDINEAEDSMKPLAAIKKEEEDETEEKEDREERIELVEDETRNVAKEMEVQMQYEITCLLKSSRVVTFSQMLQNQRMLIKLETLPEQVDGYEAKIKRMQDDHEEALVREKELEDLLDKELQCLQELYSEIEENDLAEVNGDEESSEEQVEEHPEQDSHEMAANDFAGSTEAKAEGCAKEENTEDCYDQEDSEESSMQVAEENDKECIDSSLEETSVTSERVNDASNNVTISPVTLVPSDEAGWNLQFKKLQDYYEKHGHCKLFCAVDRFPSS
jgi:hypothetical protein